MGVTWKGERGQPPYFTGFQESLDSSIPITRSCETRITDKKLAQGCYYPHSCSLLKLTSRISADKMLAWERYYPQSCSPLGLASRISADKMLAWGRYYPSAPILLSHSPQKTKPFHQKGTRSPIRIPDASFTVYTLPGGKWLQRLYPLDFSSRGYPFYTVGPPTIGLSSVFLASALTGAWDSCF